MIAVPNYGLGNVGSLINSLNKIEAKYNLVTSPNELNKYDRLILPGVGTFSKGMRQLIKTNWIESLEKFNKEKKPILGICLGMQLLFNNSQEFNEKKIKGLGFIEGEVQLLKSGDHYKIPHTGWNSIKVVKNHQIFSEIPENVDYYFVHSYKCVPTKKNLILGVTNHSEEFVSVVNKDNIVAFQFHPEKSPPSGLKLLKNFSEWKFKC